MFSNFLASQYKNSPTGEVVAKRGFGLIELMVSITIMTIVSGVILARQSSFNGAILLRSQAFEIALEAREVQLSAVSVQTSESDYSAYVDANFRSIMGLHFSKNSDSYRVFKDSNLNGFFELDKGEEFGPLSKLDSRFEIRKIEIGAVEIDEISIIYIRPNFDARFITSVTTEDEDVAEVKVYLYKKGIVGDGVCGKDYRTVVFTRTGQISVMDC